MEIIRKCWSHYLAYRISSENQRLQFKLKLADIYTYKQTYIHTDNETERQTELKQKVPVNHLMH